MKMENPVLVEKSCPQCGAMMSVELERDEFLETFVKIFRNCICTACVEYSERLEKISNLKTKVWAQLKTATTHQKKAEDASRYGARNSSQQLSEAKRREQELREQLDALEKKEQTLLADRQDHKNNQKKG